MYCLRLALSARRQPRRAAAGNPGGMPIVIHPKLLWEYRDVRTPGDRRRPDPLPPRGGVITRVSGHIASDVDVCYLWRPNLRDEGDNFVIQIAVAAAPCTVVTHNTRTSLSG